MADFRVESHPSAKLLVLFSLLSSHHSSMADVPSAGAFGKPWGTCHICTSSVESTSKAGCRAPLPLSFHPTPYCSARQRRAASGRFGAPTQPSSGYRRQFCPRLRAHKCSRGQ